MQEDDKGILKILGCIKGLTCQIRCGLFGIGENEFHMIDPMKL